MSLMLDEAISLVTNDESEGTPDRNRLMAWCHHHDYGERRASEVLRESIRCDDRVPDVACLADRVVLHAPRRQSHAVLHELQVPVALGVIA